MSVKQELEALNNKREDLEKLLEPVTAGLTQLYSERDSLNEKVNKLNNRTSPLANTLREETIGELSVINQQIASAEEKEKEVREKISKIDSDLLILLYLFYFA